MTILHNFALKFSIKYVFFTSVIKSSMWLKVTEGYNDKCHQYIDPTQFLFKELYRTLIKYFKNSDKLLNF